MIGTACINKLQYCYRTLIVQCYCIICNFYGVYNNIIILSAQDIHVIRGAFSYIYAFFCIL